jgi:hypothetical protein
VTLEHAKGRFRELKTKPTGPKAKLGAGCGPKTKIGAGRFRDHPKGKPSSPKTKLGLGHSLDSRTFTIGLMWDKMGDGFLFRAVEVTLLEERVDVSAAIVHFFGQGMKAKNVALRTDDEI